MGIHSIEGGMDTTRVADTDAAERARITSQQAARRVIARMVPDADELCDMLGLNDNAPDARPDAPAADPTGTPRVVAKIRPDAATDDWRHHSACRDEDPELFFPVGTSPYLAQVVQAKAVCRRCPVVDECLEWALANQPYGIAGGMSEDERRALKRPGKQQAAA